MAERVKNGLFCFIIAVLLLPMIQHAMPFIKSASLQGAFTIAPNDTFSINKWFDGSYQENKSKYLNDHVSFRADFIRLNCQVDYSLFGKFNTGWGVLGKNNCIFDNAYLDTWNGSDFEGYDKICTKMVKLKALQDTLAKLGKSVILVHPASKGYFYENLIPQEYIPAAKRPTNFATYLHVGDSLGINQMDLNTWFSAIRDTSRELLYSKQGIHWSFYGGMVAADTIIKYIEQLRNIKMPHPKWTDVIHTKTPRFTDDDIGRALNLIWPCATETFSYGTTACDSDATKARPTAIYIGDSFMWPIIDNGVMNCINDKWEFWFYNKTLCTKDGRTPMKNYDWLSAVNKTDYIMFMYNATNLNQLGNGFIDTAYNYYFPVKR